MKRLLKDKRGLEFRSAFFTVVVMSMVIIAAQVILNGWEDSYDSSIQTDLSNYDKLDEVSTEASSQQGKVTIKSSNTGEEFEGTSIRGVFGILNNIYAPFRVVFGDGGMIDSITERFGIPDYIRQGIITLMIFSITFALVAVLFRLPRRSA